ncbi:unnamed protein product [Rotaria socialis]|uniref:Exostosin GT47 domain-containing protein n=1 Tax=Rotaria socialis TaxID=392032 RepID=A0A819BAT1_9BILA|nr:unnamed protein product [Rotaria socialis]
MGLLLIYTQWHPALDTSYLLQSSSPDCRKLCPYISRLERDKLIFNLAYSIRHFPEFICPQNFRNLADWIYGWPNQFFENIETTTNDGKRIAPCLPPGSIIYVRTTVINEFFSQIYPYLIHNFVLITGEDDRSSPTDLSYLNRPDSKIIHWFGQNGQIDVRTNAKFTHIPIGINCYEMADSIRMVQKKSYRSHSSPPLYGVKDEPSHYINLFDVTERALSTSSTNQDHLALINFDSDTDGTGLRLRIWLDLCSRDKPIPLIECIEKPRGVQISKILQIYKRNRHYPFWISPLGNGIDCHRTWEALYLDIIPIVWNSTLNSLYENLPVLIINNHTELTESFLRDQLHRIATKKISSLNSSASTGYYYEKLRNAFWRQMILNKSRYASNKFNLTVQRRCWRARSNVLEWARNGPFLKYIQ